MKLLKEIKDKEFSENRSAVEYREAVRIVLFDENNQVPIIYAAKHNYHKIPGGGIDEGEDQIQALKREAMEKAGCEIEITDEVGKIVEFRSEWNQIQTSYCYLGQIISKNDHDFTQKEINEGFELHWMTLDDAIAIFKNDKPTSYGGKFMSERDRLFLEAVKNEAKFKAKL